MIPKWAHDIRLEDIKNPAMAELAELVGIEAMMKIVETYSGSALYIPKTESVLAAIRDRHIREEFDGTNGHKLAIRYNVSDSWVLRVVNEKQIFGQVAVSQALMDLGRGTMSDFTNLTIHGISQSTMMLRE